MFDLIKWEIKKNLRPGVIVAWVIGLMLGFNMVFTNFWNRRNLCSYI